MASRFGGGEELPMVSVKSKPQQKGLGFGRTTSCVADPQVRN